MKNIDINDFLTFLKVKRRMAEWTVTGHRSRFRIIQTWFTENNKEFTSQSVEQFYLHLQEKGLSGKGLNNYHATYRMIQKYFKDRGTDYPFLEEFEPFREAETNIIPLTRWEIELLRRITVKLKYNSWQTRRNDVLFSNVISFLAFTGCRWAECQNLKVSDVDLTGKVVRFSEKTKTLRVRRVYITEPLLTILRKETQGKQSDELVFQNTKGGKIHQPDFSRVLKGRAKEAGVTKKVNPHLFRHSYAQALYDATGNIKLVQEVLGHASVKTTEEYVRVDEAKIRDAQLSHPFVREGTSPVLLINKAEEAIQKMEFTTDARFNPVLVKKAIYEFGKLMHEAVETKEEDLDQATHQSN